MQEWTVVGGLTTYLDSTRRTDARASNMDSLELGDGENAGDKRRRVSMAKEEGFKGIGNENRGRSGTWRKRKRKEAGSRETESWLKYLLLLDLILDPQITLDASTQERVELDFCGGTSKLQ
jgi:hypothetical protein